MRSIWIRKNSKDFGVVEPVFKEINEGFQVILYKDKINSKDRIIENVTENVTEKTRENIIINLIKATPKISFDKLAKMLSVTRMTVIRDVDKLKSRGIIERIGSAKGGYWKIKDS